MSLYKLTGRKGELQLKAEHEELTEEELAELMAIEDDRSNVLNYLGELIRSLKAEADIVNAEKNEFMLRERSIKKNIAQIQGRILEDMRANNEQKHKTRKYLFTSVENRRTLSIIDIDALMDSRPDLVVTEYKADKALINDEFRQTGEVFDGTVLNEQTSHLRIRIGGKPKVEKD